MTTSLSKQNSGKSANSPTPVNVGGNERWFSTIGGSALVLAGLSRLSLKGLAVAGLGAALIHRGTTGHCPAYTAMGVDTTGKGAEPEEYFTRGVHVVQTFTINRPASDLYNYWKNFENLPKFMQHLKSVKAIDDKRSQWVVEGPAGTTLQWTAEIINDEPNKVIAWRSLGGADVDSAGSIRFTEAPAGNGTEVKVTLDYIPPAGKFGAVVARLFGKSGSTEVRSDLRRFKQIMEAGEVPTIEGQPQGSKQQAQV